MTRTVKFNEYLEMKNSLLENDLNSVFEKAWELSEEGVSHKRKMKLLKIGAIGTAGVAILFIGTMGYGFYKIHEILDPIFDGVNQGGSIQAIGKPVPSTPQYIYDSVADTVDFFNGKKFYRV